MLFNGAEEPTKQICPNCGGKDNIVRRNCIECSGIGFVEKRAEPLEKQVNLRVNPQCIESFYPCYYEGASMIVMMSGKEYMTPLSCEAIEQGIAGYWKHVNEKMGGTRHDPGRIVTLNP